MSFEYDDKFTEISKQINGGIEPQSVTVREFISWFGAQRRSYWQVEDIRRALRKHELITHPDFESVYIDANISFKAAPKDDPEVKSVGIDLVADPTYRVGRLASANKTPVSVNPEATLGEAVTLMLSNNISQLPVMTTEREVKGMISWMSIGGRLSLGQKCDSVRDCMERPYEISADTYLFDAINEIVAHQYVLVRNTDNVVSGIVTTTDLSLQFRQLGEPFLILGEIENYVRQMLQDKYTKQELVEACDPSEPEREIESVSDLTFGMYLKLIEKPDRWKKLGLSIDRKEFVKELNEIRRIRNDVMHFDPDGISESDLEKLRLFVGLMQHLAKIGVI
ncbi:MAG: CBS domain-containing protein [Halobacteriota archaeon]|nr:CBS domain-containing protein [Halobacteriota archaeon]